MEGKRRDACPWACLSSCVQMRGIVRGRADSSPIPTITVTRHPSVSKTFGPSALWSAVAPQRPPPTLSPPWRTHVLAAPSPLYFSRRRPNPCAHLNLFSSHVPAAVVSSVHVVALWNCFVPDLKKSARFVVTSRVLRRRGCCCCFAVRWSVGSLPLFLCGPMLMRRWPPVWQKHK